MAINHKISSNGYDGYRGAMKAKELRSQDQHGHGARRAESGEEGSKYKAQIRDGFDEGLKAFDKNSGSHHRNGEIKEYGHGKNFDGYITVKQDHNRHDAVNNSYNNQGATPVYQFTQITIINSPVFNGAHFDSLEKSSEAHKNFLNAALDFIKNPSEKAYKSLNDAMIKLMDPKFAPAVTGGAAQVSVSNVNGTTMAKFTMEVTPAPTKSLEEAREDLKNAYSSKRNGEKDIDKIREEAYANYVRALSEKFKQDGVISHTNNTPTTPVFKSSVIYISKVTQTNQTSFHELKKPEFKHNMHGKLKFNNPHDFWNSYRQNNKSYVDMLKHDSKPSRLDKDFKSRKSIEEKHDYRNSGEKDAKRTDNKRHSKSRTDKAS